MNWELCLPKVAGGIGLWDLKTFNLVMLAKQGWKIIQNLESLVARVSKARYFLYCSFIEANNGVNPSNTRRTLMEEREILKQGLVWRIGDGRSIDITTHKWLPSSLNFQIQNPQVASDQLQYVYPCTSGS